MPSFPPHDSVVNEPTPSTNGLPDAVDWPDLNAAQQRAVTASLAPQLVVAGPGTGKTRVLVCRTAYLLTRYDALRPSEMAVITFTRKAARQLMARLTDLVGAAAQHIRAGTIHQFCARILIDHADRLGIPNDFIIISEAVTDAFWQRWFRKKKSWCTNNDFSTFKAVRMRISQWKMGLTALPERLQTVREQYDAMLRDRNALDFDDLLTHARDALRDDPDVCAAIREQTRALLVDEFQDTDPVQYEIMQHVAPSGHPSDGGAHLFCVADDDQSIYEFRGARPQNVHDYIDRYGCTRQAERQHILRMNYRSNRAIYRVAETVLDGKQRLKHRGEIETANPSTPPVAIRDCQDEAEEIKWIRDTVARWIEDGTDRRDIAVLAPWNSTVLDMEAAFLRAGIACDASSNNPLLQQSTVRQLMAVMTFVQRILSKGDYNAPLEDLLRETLPDEVVPRLHTFCHTHDASLWGVFQRIAQSRDVAQRVGVRSHWDAFERLYAALGNVLQHARTEAATLGRLADIILQQLGTSTRLLREAAADRTDPAVLDGVPRAARWLAAWADDGRTHGHRVLLYDQNLRRGRLWRVLLRHALGCADAPDDMPDGSPALLAISDGTDPEPLDAEDLILTADLPGVLRWGKRANAWHTPPRMLVLGGMHMSEADIREAGLDPSRICQVAPHATGSATVRLFNALQAAVGPSAPEPLFPDYVMVDLETTGLDVNHCHVAEIGAVRVVDGEIVDTFEALIELPDDLSPDAVEILRDVCGLDPAQDFDDALPEAEAWAAFCDFVGARPMVAHNGRGFDFRVLKRLKRCYAASVDAAWTATYDTLPAAVELCPDLQHHSANHLREALLDESRDTTHRALADCRDQQDILDALQARRASQQRTVALEPLLPVVAGGLYLEAQALSGAVLSLTSDDRTLLNVGYRWALRDASPARDALRRHLPDVLTTCIRSTSALYDAIDEDALLRRDDDAPGLHERLRALLAPYADRPVRAGLRDVLSHLALWRRDDPDRGEDLVTLSTYHSAKGLEFERVICSGVHDSAFPAYYAETADEKRESRRVLYVGMTRAEERLVLTYTRQSRFGHDRARSPFLHRVPPALVTDRHSGAS